MRTDVRGRYYTKQCEVFFDEFKHPIAFWDDRMGNIEFQERTCKIIYEFAWQRYFQHLPLDEDIYNGSTQSARFLNVLFKGCLEILRTSLFVPEFFPIDGTNRFIIRYIPMAKHPRIQEIIALLEKIMPCDMVFSETNQTIMRKYGVRHLLEAFTHKFAHSMIRDIKPPSTEQEPKSEIDTVYSSLLRNAIASNIYDVEAIIAWLAPLTMLAHDGEGMRGCNFALPSTNKHKELDYVDSNLQETVGLLGHKEDFAHHSTEKHPMLRAVFISSLSDIKQVVLTTLSGQVTLTEKAIQDMDTSQYLRPYQVFEAYRILSGNMYKHFAYNAPLSPVLDDLTENKIEYEPYYDCRGGITYNGTVYTTLKRLKIGHGQDPCLSFHILFDYCTDTHKIIVFASGSI
ncbi:hypothetical protein MBAV_004862 [Candidatus Magnetobacterium bavaricum]|uniref:Uncharacterized protein n=1 Tax=Candidatus Magnetobacterium bavaricum TaxID=29290 RepID=A0A0F3GQK1_9BACT|nr:hypothetical protein MBAV_004862 [Candidatus Magnetobacterium bavaricum]